MSFMHFDTVTAISTPVAGLTYNVLTGSVEDPNPIGGGADVLVQYISSGVIDVQCAALGPDFTDFWCSGVPTGSEHIRVDIIFGTFTAGTTGVDIPLSSSPFWRKTLIGAGDESVAATYTIKDSSGGSTLASGDLTLRAASI